MTFGEARQLDEESSMLAVALTVADAAYFLHGVKKTG
jgi:hypothetical protein